MSENIQSINISPKNVEGKCDVKCSYQFKYPETNLTAKNNGVFISLSCDNSTNPSVVYNFEKYNVAKMLIVSPSVHLFHNETANAEILIEHDPVLGGPKLFVCIPIKESSNTTTASSLITDIINDVSTNAPSEGETTTINISDFTLENVIPKKPFFSYTGIDINNSDAEFVVFGLIESIPLSSVTLSSLSQIIKAFPIKTPGNSLFFNSSGPNSKPDDGIYISCNPTGSSTDETDVSYSKNSSNNNLGALLKNPLVQLILQIILGCILFVGIFLALNYAYNAAVDSSIKLPSIKIPGVS
jgi:hypothetical protein